MMYILCECQTVNKGFKKKKKNAAHVCFLGIWTYRVTNGNILERADLKRKLLITVRKRQMSSTDMYMRKTIWKEGQERSRQTKVTIYLKLEK